MRVGRALSILLDPSQEALFEGQGPFTVLLPEECWHSSCGRVVGAAASQSTASGPDATAELEGNTQASELLLSTGRCMTLR